MRFIQKHGKKWNLCLKEINSWCKWWMLHFSSCQWEGVPAIHYIAMCIVKTWKLRHLISLLAARRTLGKIFSFSSLPLPFYSPLYSIWWQVWPHFCCFLAFTQCNTPPPPPHKNKTKKVEVTLIFLQEYCYDNMSFMKVFQKIVMLLYKSECELVVAFAKCQWKKKNLPTSPI